MSIGHRKIIGGAMYKLRVLELNWHPNHGVCIISMPESTAFCTMGGVLVKAASIPLYCKHQDSAMHSDRTFLLHLVLKEGGWRVELGASTSR